MSDHRDDLGLGVIADHAARTGRLSSVGHVRRRGDQRRRNARVAGAALGVAAVVALGSGFALIQRDAGPANGLPPVAGTPSAGPEPSPTPTPTLDPSAVPGAGIPDREQGVWLQATGLPGTPVLTGPPDGTLTVTDPAGSGDQARFALIPQSPGAEEYLLKTAALAPWSEPACMEVSGDQVTITACGNLGEEQDVTLRGEGPAYQVLLGSRAIKIDGDRVVLATPDEGTEFRFIVRGEAIDPFD